MEIALSILAFLLGTVVGSFLNVCIYRLPEKKSIISPGSHCPHFIPLLNGMTTSLC